MSGLGALVYGLIALVVILSALVWLLSREGDSGSEATFHDHGPPR